MPRKPRTKTAARRSSCARVVCELYFHSAYDSAIAPAGKHTMSVFAQYAPYTLAAGTWADRREEIGDRVLASIARFAPGIADEVEEREVLGPPDIEARIGLTGGHIFQGECLPDQMWSRRFSPRTPVPGLYLCGAATHPGGSVIAANGRNAAMVVLADLAVESRHPATRPMSYGPVAASRPYTSKVCWPFSVSSTRPGSHVRNGKPSNFAPLGEVNS